MQEIIVPNNLNEVDAAIFLVKVGDKANAMSRELLWKINDQKLWQDKFSCWGEFVESPEGLGKSQSWASKQLSVFSHYAGKVSQIKMETIDNERLYLAMRLPGTPEEQVQRAELWDRQQIKQELASKDGKDCDHPVTIKICADCHARV